MKEKSNWKDKVSQSKHLKEYYKKNKNTKHPVFGGVKRVNTCKCGADAEYSSYKNGKLEWAYCSKCYGKRNR